MTSANDGNERPERRLGHALQQDRRARLPGKRDDHLTYQQDDVSNDRVTDLN